MDFGFDMHPTTFPRTYRLKPPGLRNFGSALAWILLSSLLLYTSADTSIDMYFILEDRIPRREAGVCARNMIISSFFEVESMLYNRVKPVFKSYSIIGCLIISILISLNDLKQLQKFTDSDTVGRESLWKLPRGTRSGLQHPNMLSFRTRFYSCINWLVVFLEQKGEGGKERKEPGIMNSKIRSDNSSAGLRIYMLRVLGSHKSKDPSCYMPYLKRTGFCLAMFSAFGGLLSLLESTMKHL